MKLWNESVVWAFHWIYPSILFFFSKRPAQSLPAAVTSSDTQNYGAIKNSFKGCSLSTYVVSKETRQFHYLQVLNRGVGFYCDSRNKIYLIWKEMEKDTVKKNSYEYFERSSSKWLWYLKAWSYLSLQIFWKIFEAWLWAVIYLSEIHCTDN